MSSKMRIMLIFDDGTEVFLPNLFFYDYFKKFVKKRKKQLVKTALKQFLKNLTIVKKRHLYFLDFKKLEQDVYDHIQNSNIIGLKYATLSDKGVHFDTGNKKKDDISSHLQEYEALKKTSRVINFHDILEVTVSRFSYLSFLDFNTSSPIEREEKRILRTDLVQDEGFYLNLYKKYIKSEWLSSSKHREVIIQFLLENSLRILPDSFKSSYFKDKDFLFLLNEYLNLKMHKNQFPIINWEIQKKWLKDTNQTMFLTRSEENAFFKENQEHFEEYVNSTFFPILKLYFKILPKENFNDESLDVIKFAIKNYLLHSFNTDTIDDEASFIFEEEGVVQLISNIEEAASIEGILFFSSHFPDSSFVKELYKYLNQRKKIQTEDKTLLINRVNPELNNLILFENWKELIFLVCNNFSNNSEFKKFFFQTIYEVIDEQELLTNFIFSNDFEIEHKKDFLYIAKKSFLKNEFKNVSKKIYSEIDLVENYETISPLFDHLHSDELLETVTKLEKNSLYKLKENTNFFEDLIELDNSNIISKIIGKLQLVDFTLFDKELKILNSNNFRSAFLFNLNNIKKLDDNSMLFENYYFFNFLLTTDGVKWLKSINGQAWLDSDISKNWRNSKKGKFVSNILLNNKSLVINSRESFDLYLSVLNSDSKEKLDKHYLINHNPETFEYLLKAEPQLLSSINLSLFNFYSELSKVILKNSEAFFQHDDEQIGEIATKVLMTTAEVHKLKDAILLIDRHFVNFYKFKQSWFINVDFVNSYKKFNLNNLFQQIFEYNINQITTISKDTLEILAGIDDKLFFEMIKSSDTTPLWLISEKYFIEILGQHSQDSIEYFDILGQRYFHKSSSSMLLNKQWFYEFVTNFSKKFINNSNTHREGPHVIYCKSGDCISSKTGKAKEGYKNFYDTLVAISRYFSYLRVINRPYQCPYTDLWHTTSQWN